MTAVDALYLALTLSPDDWLLRSVLADSLEEAGLLPVAECVRWMVRHRKRPYRASDGDYLWFDAHSIRSRVDPESDVPVEVYRHLTGEVGPWPIHRTYASLRAAEEDFHAAWQR